MSRVHTLSFSVWWLWSWRVFCRRFPALGDGWSRYQLRLGPLLLSWSHAEEDA